MNSGYDYAKVYSDWVSLNQRQVATLRVSESLSVLCERKFTIPVSRETLDKWSTLSVPMLSDLLSAEDSADDIFDNSLPLRKKEIVLKYFGAAVANEYEDHFSLHHDGYQMIQRMETLLRKKIM